MGLRIVTDRADAYFILEASATFSHKPVMQLSAALLGTPKLYHHIFVVMTNDESFPYRGVLGTTHSWFIENFKSYSLDNYPRLAEESMKFIWDRESSQIEALCDVKEELVAEGWADIEELRLQLVLDMIGIRAERAREKQEKSLTVEIEDQP